MNKYIYTKTLFSCFITLHLHESIRLNQTNERTNEIDVYFSDEHSNTDTENVNFKFWNLFSTNNSFRLWFHCVCTVYKWRSVEYISPPLPRSHNFWTKPKVNNACDWLTKDVASVGFIYCLVYILLLDFGSSFNIFYYTVVCYEISNFVDGKTHYLSSIRVNCAVTFVILLF